MRRLAPWFLAVLLGTACRDDDRVELTIATVSNPDMRMMQQLSGTFEADHPDIRLRWVVLPENDLRTRRQPGRRRPLEVPPCA